MFGFYRVAAATIELDLTNISQNAKEVIKIAKDANNKEVSIILFPELTLSGYDNRDLFFQKELLINYYSEIENILKATKDLNIVLIIGGVVRYKNRLYNVAFIIQNGDILGVVPKSYLPNKKEFYEKRVFNSGIDIKNEYITLFSKKIPFGVDLLFSDNKELTFGVEICEDLWSITPPSNYLSSNGANFIFNLSASNELIGKAQYREELVRTQSARLIASYIYSSTNVTDSTTDMVFGGDLIIAEYGRLVKRGKRYTPNSHYIYADIDGERLNNIRISETSFSDSKIEDIRIIELNRLNIPKNISIFIDPLPFVPKDKKDQDQRAKEITTIQAYGLINRLKRAKINKAILGLSGGLDSTLALLVTNKAFNLSNKDPKDIIAITMPGFGTTNRTLNNAKELANALGVTLKEIDIKNLTIEEFKAIGHDINVHDVTYENVQARVRTSILMNLANKLNALVVGTGDLSEIALGWSTYNGDHMSMYNVNSSIPKTLIKYLIEYFTQEENIAPILKDILDTPISPELLPAKDNKITQKTEDIIGPYELHDFFLYHFIKHSFTPKKILFLAKMAFKGKYEEETIKKWLSIFIKRFFTQQFKRSAMPDGPKVGTISLSPRADWRMPSDANFKEWIEELSKES